MISPRSLYTLLLCPHSLSNLTNPCSVVLMAAYAITSIPQSLPRRLSSKLTLQLAQLDYTHINATRISSEVRRALKFPADALRIGLRRSVEQLVSQRADRVKLRGEAEIAVKYFSNLVREAGDIRENVRRVELEGPAPGLVAQQA